MKSLLKTYSGLLGIVVTVLLFCDSARTQTIDFTTPVTFNYHGQSVGEVLADLSARYGVGFSYSRQIIPIQQPVYCRVEKRPFGEALQALFAQTQVIYGVIGDQIVLSIDATKTPVIPDIGMRRQEADDSMVSAARFHIERQQYQIPQLSYRAAQVEWTPTQISSELIRTDLQIQMRVAEQKQDVVRAQVTFVPPLKVDTDPRSEAPVNFSYNVLAGVTQSVAGLEMGGVANIVTNDLSGLQIAGVTNVVKGNTKGIQVAGLVNSTGSGAALQIAGLVNHSAGDVHSQISGFVNVAKHATGVQIGLLNIAGSTDGVPVGLMSIVRRRGYHSLEVAVEDAIDYNINVRLGVRAFYNILHVGLDKEGENWTLGYGIGTSIFLARRNYLQFELMARQINEDAPWTRELNLLSQLNMHYDFAISRNLRIAIGPSLNVATSRRYDAESGQYGTQVPRYVMFEHTYDDGYRLPLNVKYWVGLHAGIRFGSADVGQRGARFIE